MAEPTNFPGPNATNPLPCLSCKQPIENTETTSSQDSLCRHCNKYWHIDERCRQGLVLATQDEGRIEKCFWRQDSMRALVAAFYLPVKLALTMLKFTWPLVLLLIPVC